MVVSSEVLLKMTKCDLGSRLGLLFLANLHDANVVKILVKLVR